jgi:hypothetical protein
MITRSWRKSAVAVLAVAVVNMGFASTAHAGIVGTEAVVQTARDLHLASIRSQLGREDVRAEFAKLGVSDAAIEQRIAALSDAELATLSTQMQQAPAGGNILVLIGATFVVLMILEWVGVIDIFKKAR